MSRRVVVQGLGSQPPPGLGSRPASGGGPSPGKGPGQSLAQALLDTGITTAHAIDGARLRCIIRQEFAGIICMPCAKCSRGGLWFLSSATGV